MRPAGREAVWGGGRQRTAAENRAGQGNAHPAHGAPEEIVLQQRDFELAGGGGWWV